MTHTCVHGPLFCPTARCCCLRRALGTNVVSCILNSVFGSLRCALEALYSLYLTLDTDRSAYAMDHAD